MLVEPQWTNWKKKFSFELFRKRCGLRQPCPWGIIFNTQTYTYSAIQIRVCVGMAIPAPAPTVVNVPQGPCQLKAHASATFNPISAKVLLGSMGARRGWRRWEEAFWDNEGRTRGMLGAGGGGISRRACCIQTPFPGQAALYGSS